MRVDLGDVFGEDFLQKLEYLHLVAQKVHAGDRRADRRSKKVGSGLEYADHRDYAAGDDFRTIDWNVYSRSNRLLVRLFEEEEDLSVYLLIDASQSMCLHGARKLRQALRIAAALGYVSLGSLDRVATATFASGLLAQLPARRGKGQILELLRFWERTPTGHATSLSETARAFAHRYPRRGLVVVLSDYYDEAGFEDGLNFLRYQKHDVVVVQLTDPAELQADIRGDVRVVDAESGAARDLTLTPQLLARYRKAHAAFSAELEAFCRRSQMTYFQAPVDMPFDDIVLRMFRQGGLLR